jgi:hypothetical protein
MATMENTNNVGKRKLLHCWWECKLLQPVWKAIWSSLKKLKLELPCDPVIPLLNTYPKECALVMTKSLVPLCLLQHYS